MSTGLVASKNKNEKKISATLAETIAIDGDAVPLADLVRDGRGYVKDLGRADDARAVLREILLAVRAHYPASGPRAAGWGDYLRAIGLAERTARRLIAVASDGKTDQPRRQLSPIERLLGLLPRLDDDDLAPAFDGLAAEAERRGRVAIARAAREEVAEAERELREMRAVADRRLAAAAEQARRRAEHARPSLPPETPPETPAGPRPDSTERFGKLEIDA